MKTPAASNTTASNVEIARAAYDAYVTKDRAAIEALISDEFHFTSPVDNRVDRETYFRRCWPNTCAAVKRAATAARLSRRHPASFMVAQLHATGEPSGGDDCGA